MRERDRQREGEEGGGRYGFCPSPAKQDHYVHSDRTLKEIFFVFK